MDTVDTGKPAMLLFEEGLDTLREIMEENLGGMAGASVRAKQLRADKNCQWVTTDEVPVSVGPVLEGVILGYRSTRSFFANPYNPKLKGQQPKPDCQSPDGLAGYGNPGGACLMCPLNQFGTANGGQGAGKACREQLHLYMVLTDQIFPVEILLTPASIGPIQAYLADLTSKMKVYNAVVTRLALTPGETDTYSVAAPSRVLNLDAESKALIKSYKAEVAAMLAPRGQQAALPANAESLGVLAVN